MNYQMRWHYAKHHIAFILIPISILFVWPNRQLHAQNSNKSDSLQLEWSGYLKYLHSTLYQPGPRSILLDNLVQQRLNLDISNSKSIWSTHLGLRTRMFYGNSFDQTPNRDSTIHKENNDYLNLSLNLIDSKHLLINSYLDRLYMQWTLGSWEIRAGRQRINWGISTFWNPNDLFNSFDFTDFDYEERPGSDALRVTWYSGPVSRLEGAVKMADSWDEVTAAMLYRWNLGSFDFQLVGGKYERNFAMGGGWSGFIKDFGFKGEFMYFNSYKYDIKNTFNLTAGFDYIFGTDLAISLGYLYNEEGSTAQGSNFYTFQLSARNLYPFRHALYNSINYSFTPLLSGGVTTVFSPVSSEPWFLSPTLTYNVSQNWDIDFVSQMFVTENIGVNLNSFSYFLRLKWSF